MTCLFRGFQDPGFIAALESTSDPWQTSRTLGEKTSEIARKYAGLTREEKEELAKRAEVELKTGLDMLRSEKKRVFKLLKAVTEPFDPPTPR